MQILIEEISDHARYLRTAGVDLAPNRCTTMTGVFNHQEHLA